MKLSYLLRKTLKVALTLFFIITVTATPVAYFAYHHFTKDLPNFRSIDEYNPPSVTSVYSQDGKLIAEFFEQRRYPVPLEEVPKTLQLAFLAAEDANFFEHPGIDLWSIARAIWNNYQKKSGVQGGSTITQQIVKNILLTPERTFSRKIKEAILSYRLEKRLSKEEILELYLNEIFFGNTAYGVKAAAKLYFHKELHELNLAECALLAGLVKAPSKYSPLVNLKAALSRQRYVLQQMESSRFATPDEVAKAKEFSLKFYAAMQSNIYQAPYYVREVRTAVLSKFPDLPLNTGGYSIYTPLDLEAYRLAKEALRFGIKEVDKRRGWRPSMIKGEVFKGDSFKEGEIYIGKVEALLPGKAKVKLGTLEVEVSLEPGWLRKQRDTNDRTSYKDPHTLLKLGDLLELSLESDFDPSKESKFKIDQTPQLEGAIVFLDPHNGKVLSVVGGYDYHRSQFNRATQMMRQPGSAFKPIVYLAAIDKFGFTPTTLVNDSPRTYRIGDQVWTPGNFDRKFMGQIPLFRALELSRNLVSADLVTRIGLDAPIEYARKLGIKSPMGKNLSLSLGSSEVTPLELTRAYGVFPAEGRLYDSNFIDRILDRNGREIFALPTPRENEATVINKDSAFIMSHMMKGIVLRGTATNLKDMEREVAGKTGTTNESRDAWFVGFLPDLVCGVWVGFDELKQGIGKKETGGRVAAPIFKRFLNSYLKLKEAKDYDALLKEYEKETDLLGIKLPSPPELSKSTFEVPSTVEAFFVDKATGQRIESKSGRAIVQYFSVNSEVPPNPSRDEAVEEQESISSYLELDL